MPDEVDFRWFSHYNSFKYILSHINEIISARDAKLHRIKDIRDSLFVSEIDEQLPTFNEDPFDILF